MGQRVSIVLPSDLRFRDAAGALIGEVCRRLEAEGAEASLGVHVVSAFNEAFNNVVFHAYGPEAGAAPAEEPQVEVTLELLPGRLILQLQDSGRGFVLEEVAEPSLEDLPESGMGLTIIRACMNEVSYTPGGGGRMNVLRMVRELRGCPNAEARP